MLFANLVQVHSELNFEWLFIIFFANSNTNPNTHSTHRLPIVYTVYLNIRFCACMTIPCKFLPLILSFFCHPLQNWLPTMQDRFSPHSFTVITFIPDSIFPMIERPPMAVPWTQLLARGSWRTGPWTPRPPTTSPSWRPGDHWRRGLLPWPPQGRSYAQRHLTPRSRRLEPSPWGTHTVDPQGSISAQ